MADELTSVPVAPAPSNEPGQAQASTPVAPQQTPSAEPGTQVSAEKKPVNLHEIPEFRKYQSEQDRKFAELQRQLQEQSRRQHEATMAQLSPEQRAQYQLQLKDQEINRLNMTLEQREIAERRAADIQRLSTLSGTPASVLEQADTYDQAVELALEYARQQTPQAQAAQQQRAEANRVDLGFGGAMTDADRRRAEQKAALDRGDSRAYFKLLLGD
jgi:hypothetical protein